ncbi:enolase-phosphatase E1-like isoform X2 [Artemia franciscana]
MDFDVLLVDIEGTTTSISFVKDILFPFARSEVEKFLRSNWNSENVRECINSLRNQAKEDLSAGMESIVEIPENAFEETLQCVLNNIYKMMDIDRKVKALKTLQGYVWIGGYKEGVLKGHVYQDVKPVLDRLLEEKRKIYVYSSGSVGAQKLLFEYSTEGDMLKYFSGHFDTFVGMKTEVESYQQIAQAISTLPERILFLTDIPAEADAASSAGFQVRLVSRPGNNPVSKEDKERHNIIHSFEELLVANTD